MFMCSLTIHAHSRHGSHENSMMLEAETVEALYDKARQAETDCLVGAWQSLDADDCEPEFRHTFHYGPILEVVSTTPFDPALLNRERIDGVVGEEMASHAEKRRRHLAAEEEQEQAEAASLIPTTGS